jgi:uncharacterized protein (TIGR03790 family)
LPFIGAELIDKGAIMKTSTLLTVALLLSTVASQSNGQNSYDDVAVIINTNSTLSDSIGTYFVNARNIPASNVIRISAPVNEEIDSVQFENLRKQVEQQLVANNLVESINYLVTTKGVPLKVFRGNTFSTCSGSSSVESELCLILGPYASSIGQAGGLNSPYWQVKEDFTRKQFGFYLVTRLDGYTYVDIKKMIDNAASVDSAVLSYGKFVFDADPTRSMAIGGLNGFMQASALALQSQQHSVQFDSSTVYLTHVSNVLCYASWGSNDANAKAYTDNAKPYHGFLPGSIAETYVSTSARSFSPSTVYGQSLIADLISEGINGVKGYVYEPFSSAIANVQYVFPMYADGFTMAESFYSASLYLSWMDVVIGDPKMRISSARLPLSMELSSFTGKCSGNVIRLDWSTATEVNNYGFSVERRINNGAWESIGFVHGKGNSTKPSTYNFVDTKVLQGSIEYSLQQIDSNGKRKVSKSIAVEIRKTAASNNSLASYPNPFNPATQISVSLDSDDDVTLKVYDVTGREVATLMHGKVSAGTHTVAFNATQLPSGTYFAQLQTSTSVTNKKMLLLK